MEPFINYINKAIEEVNRVEAELVQSERKDEANLQRIRSNVYGICLTVFQVVSKSHEGATLQKEYINKLNAIAKNWEPAYEKAKAYGDVEKLLIEEIKMEVMQEAKEKFLELSHGL